jgi:hypothetical protein
MPRTKGYRLAISAKDVREVVSAGRLTRKEAVAALRARTGCGQTAAYCVIAPGGRFADLIAEDEGGRLSLT